MNIFEQALLRYLTPDKLALIREQRIAIGGAGGLGSNIAVALVRTGFRNIEILDKDKVEPSNLNRQDYTLADIGQPKVNALKARLLAINPDADIPVHHVEWSSTTANGLFPNANIIIEAFDKAVIKTAFVEYYARRARFVISGNGMAGINPATSSSTTRKIGNIFIVGDGITSIDDGHAPLAPRVIQCAARMAEIALDVTLASH